MIVVVASGYRTGSTHAYMLALDAMVAIYGEAQVHARGVSEAHRARFAPSEPHAVVKTHDARFHATPAARVIYCRRDPYDAAASQRRMQGVTLKEVCARIRDERSLYAYYYGHPHTLELRYEDWLGRDAEKLDRICAHIGIRLAPATRARIVLDRCVGHVKDVADELKRADSRTQLRPGHIGPTYGRPGAGEELPADWRAAIKEALDAPL